MKGLVTNSSETLCFADTKRTTNDEVGSGRQGQLGQFLKKPPKKRPPKTKRPARLTHRIQPIGGAKGRGPSQETH